MSERYSRLFLQTENLYTEGAPILIAAGALLKDNQTGQVLVQLKFRSISPKTLKAVQVKITPFDTLNRPLGEAVEYQYLDLTVSRDTEFGQKTAIPLPDATTRAMSVAVTEVAFYDNTAWRANSENWQPLATPTSLSKHFKDPEMIKQYQLRYGTNMTYLPMQTSDLWYCACGVLNQKCEQNCHQCKTNFAQLTACDQVELRRECEKRLSEEARFAAEQRAQKEAETREASRKAKKAALITMVILLLTAIGVTGYVVTDSVIISAVQYNNAVKLMDAGEFEEAKAMFDALGSYKNSAEQSQICQSESKYISAVTLMDAEKYEEAVLTFRVLDGYKDSEEKLLECQNAILECQNAINEEKYLAASALMEEGKYSEALVLLNTLSPYKDSVNKRTICRNAINEEKYLAAVALMEAENFEKAFTLFYALADYKDSKERAANIGATIFKVGSYIKFGTYEQDNIASNGKEDIEWLILKRENSKALVISKYALDYKQYNNKKNNTYNIWENCSLNQWLNGEFLFSAFSEDEQYMISRTDISPTKHPYWGTVVGRESKCKVFLLSIDEATEYFEIEYLVRQCQPTEYAVANGAWKNDFSKTDNGCTWWWLRDPAYTERWGEIDCATVVDHEGDIHFKGGIMGHGSTVDDFEAVRPAMWISIEPDNS